MAFASENVRLDVAALSEGTQVPLAFNTIKVYLQTRAFLPAGTQIIIAGLLGSPSPNDAMRPVTNLKCQSLSAGSNIDYFCQENSESPALWSYGSWTKDSGSLSMLTIRDIKAQELIALSFQIQNAAKQQPLRWPNVTIIDNLGRVLVKQQTSSTSIFAAAQKPKACLVYVCMYFCICACV